MERLIAKMGINFKNRPTPYRGAVPNPAKRRRHAFSAVAFLAALAVGLLFLLPGGLLQAQDDGTIEYAENGMDPVATYTGLDPEGRPIYWSLLATLPDPVPMVDGMALVATDFDDHDDFMISADGVLTFEFSPNYEMSTSETTPNVYKVVVVASDDAPGAGTDPNPIKVDYHKVTVTVTDEDEDGSISLSAQQPQVGGELTATLTDQDARADMPIINAEWTWERAPAMDGPWTLIPGAGAGATAATATDKATDFYMPAEETDGNYLRATVTYTDKHGDDKTAMAVSAHMVRAVPAGGNAAPEFSAGAADTRDVDENSPPGTNVGKPVAAGDAGDILTYTLAGTDDDSNYRIDRATGQITVGPRTMLNREDPSLSSSSFVHTVTVRATDPHGDPNIVTAVPANSGEVTVTITVKNVNEAPTINGGPTKDSQEENEDSDPNTAGIQPPTLTYMATDVDAADTISWSLEGADRDGFDINPVAGDIDATNGVTATLSFKTTPNFEEPTDADMDNMYMVTVVATDAKKLTAMRDVVITVTNANEAGKITFSSVQPKVGIAFTAALSDEDVVVGDVKWQWYNGNPDDGPDDGVIDDDATPIAKAKSDTYTPKRADLDSDGAPITFHVWATYTDSIGSTSATNMAANPVVVNQENRAPEFKLKGKVITATTRMVAENTDAISGDDDADDDPADNINVPGDERDNDPVMATDMSGTDNDTLTYTLGGRDEALFRVRSDTGQIEVGADTELDYEKKKSYMVTVTATDPSLLSATIDVTINVTDVNEPPDIAGEDDFTENFAENSTNTIETFRATDPERRPVVYWSLGEAGTGNEDLDLFSISSTGALTFNDPPDFENPGDSDANNTYKVIVVASDDAPGVGTPTMSSMKNVTITVTNVLERGSITLNKAYPQVGVAVEATLTDGDRVAAAGDGPITWQWYKGNTELSDANGASTATYTPQAGDRPSIKVVATYPAKGDERTVTKSGISVRAAPENNGDPTFPDSTTERSVDENKPAGANVGKPITATDPDTIDSGKLTYTLSDNTNFTITTSGQLKTKVALDHETNESLPVTVFATDPSDRAGEVIVTVTINDVNEAPMITGPTRALPKPENTPTTEVVAVYTASDLDEGAALVWSLTGPDASDFNIGNQDGVDPGTLTFKEMPDYEMPAASNNLYRVTVEVSDGNLKATRPMTVMVTDVEEEGKVTLSSVQPKVAIDLTASLKDSDGDEENIEWQWARTSGRDSSTTDACPEGGADDTWTDIDGAEMATYTPDDDDLYQCLQATASYTDRRGDGKTAIGVSDNAVIVNTDNRAPEFKDQPSSLKIAEDSDADDAVGNIQANDPNDDTLTYKLTGDAALFEITSEDDPETDQEVRDEHGEITVKTDDTLNYEAKNTYMVTVTATDPNGLSDTIDVTIKVTDVDEAPKIITGGLVVRGTSDTNYAENGMGMVATYSAAGPDADMATWTLEGDDAGDFMITDGMLTFMSLPDYENPMDADMDNVYMVTIMANDGANDAMKAVTVRVTNEEEPGEVTLSMMQPMVGTELTAMLDDPDGMVTGEMWQWARTMDMADGWTDITGAMDASYTPVAMDEGYYLRATVSYTDGHGSGKTAMEMTDNMVTTVQDQAGTVTLSMMQPMVGTELTAMLTDPDGSVSGEMWQWARTMDMADEWTPIAGAMDASYTPVAMDEGYYLRATVSYTDGHGSGKTAMEMTDNMVTTVQDQAGTVTLSMMQPMVGTELTAMLTDPDDMVTGEMWQWARTMDMADEWTPIAGAMDASYTPVAMDEGYYLQATVSYTDGHGSGKSAMAMTDNMVAVTAEDPLVDRYDANDDEMIQKVEVLKAINDYLFGEGDEAISKPDVLRLINLYLFG